ncbi:MAG: hypothetical protein ACLP05_02790 [Candidatus Kryptoniota bacterium]
MRHFFNEKYKLNKCTSQDMLPVKARKVSEDNAHAIAVELLMKEKCSHLSCNPSPDKERAGLHAEGPFCPPAW